MEVGLVIDITAAMSPNNNKGVDLPLMTMGLMEETDQMVKRGGLASTLIDPDKKFHFLICTISLASMLIHVSSFV